MYTTPEQTAKLIELGFEKPSGISGYYTKPPYEYDAKTNSKIVVYDDTQYPIYAYSIGELISFLPKSIKVNDLFFTLCIHSSNDYWIVEYADIAFGSQARLSKEELIDALFAEIVILKEEEVI